MRKKWLTKRLLAAVMAGILTVGPLGITGFAVSAQEESTNLTEAEDAADDSEDASDEASLGAGSSEEASETEELDVETELLAADEEEALTESDEAAEADGQEEKPVLLGTDQVPTAAVTSDAEGNKLQSGSWEFWTGEGGAGDYSEDNGPTRITVNAEGGQIYAVQYTQMVNLVQDSTYRLTGDFYCEDDAVVFVNLQETASWGSIIVPENPYKIELTGGEVYHLDLTTAAASAGFVNNGKLALMFGSGTGNAGKTIYVSDMALVNTDPGKEPTDETSSDAVDLQSLDTELYVGSDWAGANASKKETGSKAVINAASFGWNGEWGLQYIIKNFGFEANTDYHIEFDITSTVDKRFFLKIDDKGGFIAEEVALAANETLHYSKDFTFGQLSESPFIYFALGKMAGEEDNRSGVITIDNMKITKAEGGSSPVSTKGPEYDFTKDNSAYDYADPGTGKDGYTLVWSDEFDGNYAGANVDGSTGLNLDNWAAQLGDGTTDCGNTGWGNNELQCYTGSSRNVGVNEDFNNDGKGEGVLRITAAYEDGGYNYAGESTKRYTSARLRTTKGSEALFNTTYGYVEARIALPNTAGAWPAFWMLPQSTDVYGNWPTSGEIDIMETCGAFDGGQDDIACGTLHWGTPQHVYKGSGYVDLFSPYTYFHTYAIDWKPGEITWYYDGQPINTLNSWEGKLPGHSDSLDFDAPFDMPFYMILNLAVDSGQFGGSVNKAGFQDNINMYVDYVRVFHRNEGYDYEPVMGGGAGSCDDFADYAGINQIAEITEAALDGTGGGLNDAASDMSKWYLSYQSDAKDASLSCVKDESGKEWAKVSIPTAGGLDYSVQLIGHYNARKGYAYRVSFDAYADGNLKGKSIDCDSKEWKGWSAYGIDSFKLSGEPERYAFSFLQSENFDNCRIEFNLGARGTGNVYISNVMVEIIDPAEIGMEERKPLGDGNLIYNGSFDEGVSRIGYWSAADGTKITVPKYTTEKIDDSDIPVYDVATGTTRYYNRRAMVTAEEGIAPAIYQAGIELPKDTYTVKLDMYSETDSAIKAAVYSVKEVAVAPEGAVLLSASDDGVKLVLDKELGSAAASYKKEDGLRSYTLVFDTTEDAVNGALVITFAKGTAVLLDNVYMKGEHQVSDIDEQPLKADASYKGDNGGGGAIAVTTENGVSTMKGITSGGTWYTPQFISDNFKLAAGQKYKFSCDYKLEGTSNNSFDYIIQEDGGSWHVYGNGPTKVSYDPSTADGFNHYEFEFNADATIDNVHLVFGFGNSQAVGNLTFALKNAVIEVVKASADPESGSGSSDNEEIDKSLFENDKESGSEGGSDNPGTDKPKPGHGSGGSNSGGNNNSGNSGNDSDSGNGNSGSNGNNGSTNNNAGTSAGANAAATANTGANSNAGRTSSSAGGRGNSAKTSDTAAAASEETTETVAASEEQKTEEVLVADASDASQTKEAAASDNTSETKESNASADIADDSAALSDKPQDGRLSDFIIYVILGIAVAGSAAAVIAYSTVFRKKH